MQTISFTTAPELITWLCDQAKTVQAKYLLAHADDGVIWGRFEAENLRLSGDVFAQVKVDLRPNTLQQARLFGPNGEISLWRVENHPQGSFYWHTEEGKTADPSTLIKENYRLWGEAEEIKDGFSLMDEGQQGLLHALPIPLLPQQRATLTVYHCIEYPDDQATITHSRLVSIQSGEE